MNRKSLLAVVLSMLVVLALAGCSSPEAKVTEQLKGTWYGDKANDTLEFVTDTDFTATPADGENPLSGTYVVTDETHMRMKGLEGQGDTEVLVTMVELTDDTLVLQSDDGDELKYLRDKSKTTSTADDAAGMELQKQGDQFVDALEQGVDWEAFAAEQSKRGLKEWSGYYVHCQLVADSVRQGDYGLQAEVEWLMVDQAAADNASQWVKSGRPEDLHEVRGNQLSDVGRSATVTISKGGTSGLVELPGGYFFSPEEGAYSDNKAMAGYIKSN